MPAPAITQGLTALLPSYPASNKPFPPSLISQCESLLALSRQRASHLKVEEEIARAHACCEIACKRLRAQLRLPAIKSGAGAPCKPKVYTKLIGYLEGILLGDGPIIGPSTPSKGKKRDASGTIKESSGRGGTGSTRRGMTESSINSGTKGDETPSKKRTTDRTPTTFTGKVKNNQRQTQDQININGDKAPNFVMPAIRKLCKHFSTTPMTPHIYTGTCIILELAKLWPPLDDDDDDATDHNGGIPSSSSSSKEQILNLIIALYMMILTKMRKGKMTKTVYSDVSSQSLKLLGLDEDVNRSGMEDWVGRLNREGWCIGLDWWGSVPEDVIELGLDNGDGDIEMVDGGGMDGDYDDDDDEEGLSRVGRRNGLVDREKIDLDLDLDDPDGVLLPGLGTMLHYGVDWTSEDRKLDFEEWKTDLLRRMALLERGKSRKGKATAIS